MKSLAKVTVLSGLLSMGVGVLSLAGCDTWKGLGKDIKHMGTAMEGDDSVAVSGTNDRQMTVTVPRSVTVKQGKTETLEVKIERKNFTDSVGVAVSQLPSGVSVDDSSKKVDLDEAVFVVKASNTAEPVTDHAVKVTVDGPGGMKSVQFIRMTVKQ